jgi:surface antigen
MRLQTALIALSLAFGSVPWTHTAKAARGDARTETRVPTQATTRPPAGRPAPNRARTTGQRASGRQASPAFTPISCVPYARQRSGLSLRGNGREWWNNAAGRYARGQRPEEGSVLSFPASGSMRHGHVAVVSRVIEPRVIEIDHANWGGPGIRRGQVMRGVRVMDVSDTNDWTAVRVQVGWTSTAFGRVYPTHGFIHARSADGSVIASDERDAQPAARVATAAPRARQANRTVPAPASRTVQQASARR